MKYIVHVIDDASQHEKIEGKFQLMPSIALDSAVCEILRSDAFYLVEAESPMDAVTLLANTIKIKKSDNEEVLLSEKMYETNKNMGVADFSGGEAKSLIDDSNIKVVNNAYSEFFMAPCQVAFENDEGSYIELHKVYFYVAKESEIIEVQ